VGFGITAPELGYDDYKGIDVKGRFVAVEPEAPMGPEPDAELFKKWRPYSFHDYKMENAAAHGAIGVVYDYFIVNPNAPFIKGLQWAAVSRAVMDDLFAGTGRKHGDLLAQIRKTLVPASMPLGKTMTIGNVTEHHPRASASTWWLMEEPIRPEAEAYRRRPPDHLGLNLVLMPGAHDNASGAAVALAVAEALSKAAVPLKRSVVIILFGAEEQGVKGSEYYVAHPFIPNSAVTAFLNLESVGRGERIGVGSGRNYPQIYEVMEKINARFIHRPISASQNERRGRGRTRRISCGRTSRQCPSARRARRRCPTRAITRPGTAGRS
jgi:hypothetical protein